MFIIIRIITALELIPALIITLTLTATPTPTALITTAQITVSTTAVTKVV
jgi:hypothetical protein